MGKFENYFKAVEYLEDLPSIKNGCFLPASSRNPEIYLERTRFFLNLLGNPQDNLKFIHVTGTSGKGSVSAMIAGMLSASGKKTGLFSSPYVTTSIEKASVDGKYISPDEFADIVEFFKPKIEEANEKCPFGRPTYFEIFFALSIYYFAQQKCDIVVLEVGCGGRHDATNIIENTLVSVITNIGLDHTHIIGDTLEKIAYEKAGIIKKDRFVFTNEKRPEILKIIDEECEKVGTEREEISQLIEKVEYVDDGMRIKFKEFENFVESKLWGKHQVENMNLAVSVAKHFGISNEDMKKGIEKTNIPCRFEIVQKNPTVVLDGAHNPSKMQSTAENIKKLSFERLVLVVGISENKDAKKSLEKIVPLADQVIATTISFGKSFDPAKIIEISRNFSKKNAVFGIEDDHGKALERALAVAGGKDLVLVTGSFYLAGEVRKKWFSEEDILEKRSSFESF